jgi:hypothetical protein
MQNTGIKWFVVEPATKVIVVRMIVGVDQPGQNELILSIDNAIHFQRWADAAPDFRDTVPVYEDVSIGESAFDTPHRHYRRPFEERSHLCPHFHASRGAYAVYFLSFLARRRSLGRPTCWLTAPLALACLVLFGWEPPKNAFCRNLF